MRWLHVPMPDDIKKQLSQSQSKTRELSDKLSESTNALNEVEDKIKELTERQHQRIISDDRISDALTSQLTGSISPASGASAMRPENLPTATGAVPLRLVTGQLSEEQVTVRPGEKIRSFLFSESVEDNTAALCVKDENGEFLYANRTCRELFQLDNLVGRCSYDLVSPEQGAKWRQLEAQVFRKGDVSESLEEAEIVGARKSYWFAQRFLIEGTSRPMLGVIKIEVANLVATVGVERALPICRLRFSETSVLKKQLSDIAAALSQKTEP